MTLPAKRSDRPGPADWDGWFIGAWTSGAIPAGPGTQIVTARRGATDASSKFTAWHGENPRMPGMAMMIRLNAAERCCLSPKNSIAISVLVPDPSAH
ncbi:MAG: hypothetical protein LC797_05210 [Chloroflexi bacterium]|nr:hypothetical protein [Chloroflexota bacterium]